MNFAFSFDRLRTFYLHILFKSANFKYSFFKFIPNLPYNDSVREF